MIVNVSSNLNDFYEQGIKSWWRVDTGLVTLSSFDAVAGRDWARVEPDMRAGSVYC